MRLRATCVCLLVLALSRIGAEDRFELKNHFSLGLERDQKHQDSWLELNWQPQLGYSYPLLDKLELSGEYSMQNRLLSNWQEGSYTAEIKLDSYRWWLRLATDQTQVLAGLQRLNFGSAMILRPLRWFDTLDPLDANQETQGVKALLIRHNWLNNANLWLWAMPGSDDLKGMELLSGRDDRIELGGRLQLPSRWGETAISYHQRELIQGREYRLGLDHRLDSFMGLWLESSGSLYENVSHGFERYQLSATLGGDYTVGIANGLAFTLEHMILAGSNDPESLHNQASVSALMANYPLGLLDGVTILGSWHWTDESGNLSALYRRAYDYLSFDLGLALDTGMPDQLSRSPYLYLKVSYDI